MLHTVLFRKENVTVHVADGTNLRRACLDSGIDPYPALGGKLSCHGKGLCGTCVVGVDKDEALSPPAKREAKYLKKRGVPGLRLSCQCEVKGDVIVTTDPDTKPAWKTHPFYSGKPARSWDSAA
jgi:ferredoxin